MNVKSIRNKVRKAIKSADCTVEILRKRVIDDGMGGVITMDKGVKMFDLECVIDNSANTVKSAEQADYKNLIVDKTPILVCLYDEAKMPQEGDFFIANGKRYTIEYIDDVLMLHIYLQCRLKVIDNG